MNKRKSEIASQKALAMTKERRNNIEGKRG
jgi:hypothetical protein